MTLSEMLLPEFAQEMTSTRNVLAVVPADKFDWKPHDKSWTLQELATHVATIPHWATMTIEKNEFDLAPPGGELFRVEPAASVEELLTRFDGHVEEAGDAIKGASDEHLHETWRLLVAGNEQMAIPRMACLRSFVMNHLIHHRGQLSLYLRMCDQRVPMVYGPTADEM